MRATITRRIKKYMYVLGILLILRAFVFEICYVSSNSMNNSLFKGDYVFVLKSIYSIRTPDLIPFTNVKINSYNLMDIGKPKRNDILVFYDPRLSVNSSNNKTYYIKRCIGLAGETIEIKDKVKINGFNLNQNDFVINSSKSLMPKVSIPQIGDSLILDKTNIDWKKSLIKRENHWKVKHYSQNKTYIVTNNHYFVLGDNRIGSYDSRDWGFLPESYIKGKALVVLWSWDADLDWYARLKSIKWDRILKLI